MYPLLGRCRRHYRPCVGSGHRRERRSAAQQILRRVRAEPRVLRARVCPGGREQGRLPPRRRVPRVSLVALPPAEPVLTWELCRHAAFAKISSRPTTASGSPRSSSRPTLTATRGWSPPSSTPCARAHVRTADCCACRGWRLTAPRCSAKFELNQVTLVDAKRNAVTEAATAGAKAGAEAGEAAGRSAGERAAESSSA
jgi:hypothetical protein